MAQRTKKGKMQRTNPLRVEALEQRQLLATIVSGAGVEVASDVKLGGNVYDQILLTGSSVTVQADTNQIVRVSFLDQSGDIVQAEFAGSGLLTVALEDIKRAGEAGYNNANPAQAFPATVVGTDGITYVGGSTINYVQGLASVYVQNPEFDTNVTIYSAGPLINPGLYNGKAQQGGNHFADVARLILVGDPTNAAGYSNFGTIRAGNAVFSAETGVVGIRGEFVAPQGKVIIGDIDAKGSGVPTLMFNSQSQFQTVFVAGGDLQQTNGASFDTFGGGQGGAPSGGGNANNITLGGFSFFNSIDGTNSAGTLLWRTPVDQDAIRLAAVDQYTPMSGDWVFNWTNPQAVVVTVDGKDVSGVFGGNWLAKGGIQASLDYAFALRAFEGDVTIIGDVPANMEIDAADFGGDVTIDGNLFGVLAATGYGAGIDGTLLVTGNLDGVVYVNGLDRTGIRATIAAGAPGGGTGAPTPATLGSYLDGQTNRINSIEVEGNVGTFADIRGEEIGDVWVQGNFRGLLTTDIQSGVGGIAALVPPPAATIGVWHGTLRTATSYTDVDGTIGNVSVGYDKAGKSTGGSIINGTIGGISGIGNVKVGGDVWGTPAGPAVFVTASNGFLPSGQSDVRAYGTANIGNIEILGDVDLDTSSTLFALINGNGKYGNITVQGKETTAVTPGPQIGTELELIPGSETFIRLLSPFTDTGFKADPNKGQAVVQNYDPDGVAGPLNSDYIVTKGDVDSGAKIFTINSDGTVGSLVNAKVGDRVPVVVGGVPVRDALGNVLFFQNTALFEGKFQEVPVFGPDIVTVISGNRGDLNGTFNNFGSIVINGHLGAQQPTTGTITWTDSVDMDFGGVQVNAQGVANAGVLNVGTLGTITINSSASGKATAADAGVAYNANLGADFVLSGLIGSEVKAGDVGGYEPDNANQNTAFIGLQGFKSAGFEDVSILRPANSVAAFNLTRINDGITITTATGVGNGTGVGTVSPTVTIDALIRLDDGTTEGPQNLLLNLNVGSVNSEIRFTNQGGLVVDDGLLTGSGSRLSPVVLSADHIWVDDGALFSARTIDGITLNGGDGIRSTNDAAVNFYGQIITNNLVSVTGTTTKGDLQFEPSVIQPATGQQKLAEVGPITLTTATPNHGGDIFLGSGATYAANFGAVSLTASHKLFVDEAGAIIDNPGHIDIDLSTLGNVASIAATTTTGDITNAVTIQGNAGDITYKAGVATVAGADLYAGAVGDLVRAGSISATQTIWGTRGVTTFEVAGQAADGKAAPVAPFTVNGVTYDRVLPAGTISATLNYAGASSAATNALVAKSGAGSISITETIIGVDDNADGVIGSTEIGHGNNTSVNSISGDLTFAGRTTLPDFTHFATFGDLTMKTGDYALSNGFVGAAQLGTINVSFDDSAAVAAQGFEGGVGAINLATTGGNITWGASRFDSTVKSVTMTTGALAHSGGTIAGNIVFTAGVTFIGDRGLFSATTTDIGTITGTVTSNGETTGTGISFVSQYGAITTTVAAGSFDQNNNGLVTADEFARSGDVVVASQGGPIALTLNSNAYASDFEQSLIGNVTVTNKAYVDVKDGNFDVIGAGKSAIGSTIAGATGNVTITGAGTQVGGVSNIKATTNVGLITHTGTFGDLGTVDLATTEYYDNDTVPNTTAEAPALLANGNVQLGAGFNVAEGAALIVNGAHGKATYSVTEAGTILGTAYYGGKALGADSTSATTVRGNLSLALWLQDADRDGSGTITANEYGTHGTAVLNSASGDITLFLGTDQNNAAVAARNLVPELAFGAVSAKTGDRYTTTSETGLDTVANAGDITITGAGADATNAFAYGPITGHRGVVSSVTADVTRGAITFNGNFAEIGNQNLTAGNYSDAITGGSTVIAGTIDYSPSIWGAHGTATLKTTDSGGTTAPVGGTITGTAFFGGSAKNADTLVATTQRANINLDVFSLGYDINGDTKVTDGAVNNVPGTFEFAKVGNLKLETTNAGDATLGIATGSADGSLIGSSIGAVTVTANDDLYTAKANDGDTVVDLGNATVIGKSAVPITGGTIGDITMVVNTGAATLQGNFNNLGAVNITTGTYTDTSDAGGGTSIQDGGDIVLGNANAGADNANADTGGFSTLNIAGSYATSTFSVPSKGTIIGEVFLAGKGGKDWNLTSVDSTIDVNFVAGWDANNNGKIDAAEAGEVGKINATSGNGNVTIGVGGRNAASVIGDVSLTTGSKVTVLGTADTFVNGNAEIQGLSTGFLGKVGNLAVNVLYGNASVTGDLNDVGTITLTQDAYVDTTTNTNVNDEDPVVIAAGDLFLGTGANALFIGGSYGLAELKTVDYSKLPLASLISKSAALVTNTGDITTNVFVAGTAGAEIKATTDRGTIAASLEAGFDKDNADADNNRSTGEETGVFGNVTLTSGDGDITVTVDTAAIGSVIGNVSAKTGTTVNVVSGADTIVSEGDITFQGNNDGETANGNLGTVGTVMLTATSGDIAINGTQWNLGAVTAKTGAIIDIDSNSNVVGEDPVVVAAGDITLGLTVRRNHGPINLTTADDPTNGRAPAADTGTITGTVTFNGALTGGTDSVVAKSDQGIINLNVKATQFLKVADTGVTVDSGTTNTDDFLGSAGNVSLASVFGNVSVDLETDRVAAIAGGDATRFSSIGKVSASTGTSVAAQAGASNDTIVQAGAVAITAASSSNGILGDVTGSSVTGGTTMTGTYNNVVGNILLTAAQVQDTTTIAAGNTALTASFATSAPTTVGTIGLTTQGTVDNAGVGAAGNANFSPNLGGAWTDADADNAVDAGETNTFSSGAITVTVTDGTLTFSPSSNTTGFGVALSNVSAKTTGTSTFGATGDITVGNTGSYSTLSNLLFEAANGATTFSGTWEAPTISGVTIRSLVGNATLSGSLTNDFVDATNSKTANVSISNFTLQSNDGNVTLSGTLGETVAYNAGNVVVNANGSNDARTATMTNISLLASNGGADAGAADGLVNVTGSIGGNDTTRIDGLVFTAGTALDDTITLNNAAVFANVFAHNMGVVTFNGTTKFNTVAVPNIIADDSFTGRSFLGKTDYRSVSTATTPGLGSLLNTIDGLQFNGSIDGDAADALATGTNSEVRASKLGFLTVVANVDPTTTVDYSVRNFDVRISNQAGEFIADKAATAAATGYNQITAFNIGNISITHKLQGASFGTGVFAGSSTILGLGGMGNINILSEQKGSVQAPMFEAGGNGNAWFVLGDGDANVSTATVGAGSFSNVTNGAATGVLPEGKLAVGNVTINVGSSYVPPAPQFADIGNAGGGTGGGFAIAVGVAVNGAGNFYSAGGAEAALIDAGRALFGYINDIDISNSSIRPDNDTIGAEPGNTAAAPGAIVVAGDGTAADDIRDMVNELDGGAIRPIDEGQYYLVGDDDAGNDTDADDVLVYVL